MIKAIYTDGSCLGNPGPGGWALIAFDGQKRESDKKHGYEIDTTNNRMEMTAIIMALQLLPPDSDATIFSDSNLIVQSINQNWKRKANLDLWMELDPLRVSHPQVQFQWVKAHAKNQYNNLVDQLAVKQAKLAQKKLQANPDLKPQNLQDSLF